MSNEVELRAAEYIELTLENLNAAANKLKPHLILLLHVRSYADLLNLDEPVLKQLVAFESAHVKYLEAQNEMIDFNSGGHHRDCLDIYENALSGEEPPQFSIHLDENGKLHFSPHDVVGRFS